MKRGYLGIDESNHGIIPEVFAGVFSYRETDIAKGKPLHKKRVPRDISSIANGRMFRHIIISAEDKQILGYCGVRIVAFTELIHFFGAYGLERVVIDGDLRECDAREVRTILYPQEVPHIEGIAKADTSYPLVNIADQIAYQLAQYYTRLTKSGRIHATDDYIDHRITPQLERYGGLVKRLHERGRR